MGFKFCYLILSLWFVYVKYWCDENPPSWNIEENSYNIETFYSKYIKWCYYVHKVSSRSINQEPSNTADLDSLDSEFNREDRLIYRHQRDDVDESCGRERPTTRDIIRRIYAILPYFDRDHSNLAFIHKFRASIHGMSEVDDLLDREAAFYASVLTPLVFLHQYRDTWCLLERFHRAIRLYQISHPTEKRSALKLLQNFRAVRHKVQVFVRELPGPATRPRTTTTSDSDDEELHDKKDIRYLKELIKNLG